MSYDKEKIFKQALEAVNKYKLIFIEEITPYIPISNKTFYQYYPVGSKELQTIKNAINKNKVDMKAGLRHKWYKKDNATTQIALYKLLSNEIERKILNNQDIEEKKENNTEDKIQQLLGALVDRVDRK